jgi:hypothetical protein
MIQLTSKDLTTEEQTVLQDLQSNIDMQTSFESKVEKAQNLWDNKSGAKARKTAFETIKTKLIAMCVSVEICNYCENNEATDIEHLYPKSHFPERAFKWENYILACKTCNTTYKNDDFAVFNPVNSTNKYNLIGAVKGKPTVQPPTDAGLLIDIRNENPLEYLWLDLKTFLFVEIPLDITTREYHKANYTLWLLKLNERDGLSKAREQAAGHYFSRLKMYVSVKKAIDFVQIESAIDDFYPAIDVTVDFVVEQQKLLAAIKNDIVTYQHPTVWRELVRQRLTLPKTNVLFLEAPEAINWLSTP